MKVVLFTKLFGGAPISDIASQATPMGFDGIDLLVRQNASIEPTEVTKRLPLAVDKLRSAGLGVPMVTTDLTSAGPDADELLGACSDSGVGLVRLGYWRYDGIRRYNDILDDARSDLVGLATLAAKHQVAVSVQIHGGTIHSSGALLRNLLADTDPMWTKAYIDPGNQAVQDGREDWRLTVDLVQERLACVGVKNGGWFRAETPETEHGTWSSEWLNLADGMVPWTNIVDHLKSIEYHGILSLHSHYERPLNDVLAQTRADAVFVRNILAGKETA